MATSVYEPEIMTLDDGTEITMKPLKIIRLRKFMKVFGRLTGETDDDKQMDTLTECVILSLGQWNPEIANKKYIEDNFDINNYYDAIKAAAGIDMRSQGNA